MRSILSFLILFGHLAFGAAVPVPATSRWAVVSKTTTYTAKIGQLVLADTSGGTWTLSLPSAAGAIGRSIMVRKTSNDVTALTIDPSGSETINGSTTTTLNTIYESITLVSDGTNWVGTRFIPSEWVAYTPTTQGLGTVSSVSVVSRRVGDSLEVQGGIGCGTSTAVEARIGIGFNGTAGNVTIDTTKSVPSRLCGNAIVGFVAAKTNTILSPSSNQTYVNVGRGDATYNPAAARLGTEFCSSGQDVQFYFRVAIVGWKN